MIEVKNLTKVYGTHRALDNLTFTVKDGEILGFLGPNGAGKSTTMNIITGFLSATTGSVTVNGFDILEQPQKAKQGLGYLPEIPPLYEDMLVYEYLEFVAEIKKVKKSERKEMLNKICEKVLISDISKRLIKNLSKGYKQRVGLAQAMVGNPEVLILDEPTVGLDPNQIIEMRNVIKELGAFHTIILSSHILSEISAVCDRVMIINKGKIVASDKVNSLSKNISDSNNLLLRVKGAEENITSVFNQLPNIIKFDIKHAKNENAFDVEVFGRENIDIRESVFYALSEKKLPILMMKTTELSLEEIFIKLTSDAQDFDSPDDTLDSQYLDEQNIELNNNSDLDADSLIIIESEDNINEKGDDF